MKILWIDLNSSYAHSSLALPALHAQIMTDPSIEWEIVSATINENTGMIVDEIYRHRPDILAATTWLFVDGGRYDFPFYRRVCHDLCM